jgi:hypothetical protein
MIGFEFNIKYTIKKEIGINYIGLHDILEIIQIQ